MWLNYAYKDFSGVRASPGGEANLDLIRLSVDGRVSDLLISLQYRWYPYMHVVHHAWIGHDLTRSWQLQAGVVRVPFGLQPYASHSYWFGIPYYVGLEDDYDTGLSLVGKAGNFDLQFAALKNSEWGCWGEGGALLVRCRTYRKRPTERDEPAQRPRHLRHPLLAGQDSKSVRQAWLATCTTPKTMTSGNAGQQQVTLG